MENKYMLPYSIRKDFISFTDKKWECKYQLNNDGSHNIENPSLYELMPSWNINKHYCKLEKSIQIDNLKLN